MPYFDEPVGRVKIQTTSKNSQRYYYTSKRLIRGLLRNERLDPRLLPWQRYNVCHFDSFVTYISGAKFEEQHVAIFLEIFLIQSNSFPGLFS